MATIGTLVSIIQCPLFWFLKYLHDSPTSDHLSWRLLSFVTDSKVSLVRVFSALPCSSYWWQLQILAPWTQFWSTCSLWMVDRLLSSNMPNWGCEVWIIQNVAIKADYRPALVVLTETVWTEDKAALGRTTFGSGWWHSWRRCAQRAVCQSFSCNWSIDQRYTGHHSP